MQVLTCDKVDKIRANLLIQQIYATSIIQFNFRSVIGYVTFVIPFNFRSIVVQ